MKETMNTNKHKFDTYIDGFKIIHITPKSKGVRFESVKGGGPGGQNVNKRATKAILYFNIQESDKITLEQKRILLQFIDVKKANDSLRQIWNKTNAGGIIVIDNQNVKSKEQNIENAFNTLNLLLNKALKPEKPRNTKIPKKVKTKRKKASEKKKLADYKKKKSGGY